MNAKFSVITAGSGTIMLFLATSLSYSPRVFANEETLMVNGSENSAAATSTGYVATDAEVATKSPTALKNTPQFVSVVKRDQMDVQNATTLSQALHYNSGVAVERFGAFASNVDFARIRGFDADSYLDGLKVIGNSGIWSPQIETWGLERVEALHGPSSMLYGQSGAGGIIDMVSRRPSTVASNQLKFEAGNHRTTSLSLDSTGALTDDERWLYRFDALAGTQGSQIEDTRQKRLYLAPSITFQPDEKTRWTLLMHYLREPRAGYYNTLPAQMLGLLPNPYGRIDTDKNYSNPDHEHSSRTQYDVTSLFSHTFNNGMTLKQNLRYSHVNSAVRRDFTRAATADLSQLTAQYQDSPSTAESLAMDNQLSDVFHTGPVEHRVLTGLDYQLAKLDKNLWVSQTVTFDPYSAHYRPNFTPVLTPSTATTQHLNQTGVYAQDELIWQNWHLLLGGRHDWSQIHTLNRLSHTRLDTDDRAWSYRAGVTYPFSNGVSPWVSTSSSFSPLTGTNASGQPFKPTRAVQYETGMKFHPEGSALIGSIALYQLTQRDVNTVDPLNPSYYTQTGAVRSRGIEIEGRAMMTESLSLLASYAWVNNVVTSATDSTLGKHPVGVPAQNASLWVDYRFNRGPLQGLLLGGGVRYLGASWGDSNNTFKVPANWLGDLSVRYSPGHWDPQLWNLELGLTVTNVMNRSWVSSCTSAPYCSIGAERSILGSVSWNF